MTDYMTDYWGGADHLAAQGRLAVAVAPNDNADLPLGPCKALWVSGAGTVQAVSVADTGNSGVPLGNLPAGTLVPLRVRRVPATGTTATLLALY